MADYILTLDTLASDTAFEDKYGSAHAGSIYLNSTDKLPHLFNGSIWVALNNHNFMSNIGVNSHTVIDDHISNLSKHFEMLDEDNMISNSSSKCPTQQSARAYTSSHIADTTVHFEMLNESDMISSSTTKTATQGSIKTYIDTKFSSGYFTYGEEIFSGALVEINSLGKVINLTAEANFFGIAQEYGVPGYLGNISILGRTSTVHSGKTPGNIAYIQPTRVLGDTLTAYPAGRWISATKLKVTKKP